MTDEFVETIKKYISEVTAAAVKLRAEEITSIVKVIEQARQHGNRVFIFGNGGSAATASHLANDLSKGTMTQGNRRIKAIALTDNMPLISAWANDTSYENVFAEQVKNLTESGDVVIGISASGNSPNVLNGIKEARNKGATTIGFIGFDGGKLKDLVDIAVVVPSHAVEQAEDVHLLLGHVITICLRGGLPSA